MKKMNLTKTAKLKPLLSRTLALKMKMFEVVENV